MNNKEIKEEKLIELRNKFYSCYDKTGICLMGLFPANTDMQAIRFIEDAVKNPESALAKHPDDYTLCYVCEINMRTGEVIDNTVRKIIEVGEYATK